MNLPGFRLLIKYKPRKVSATATSTHFHVDSLPDDLANVKHDNPFFASEPC